MAVAVVAVHIIIIIISWLTCIAVGALYIHTSYHVQEEEQPHNISHYYYYYCVAFIADIVALHFTNTYHHSYHTIHGTCTFASDGDVE